MIGAEKSKYHKMTSIITVAQMYGAQRVKGAAVQRGWENEGEPVLIWSKTT